MIRDRAEAKSDEAVVIMAPVSGLSDGTALRAAERIREIAPIAKRDPDASRRANANAELRVLYATMARLQAAGVATPDIDMGAL